MIAAGAKKLIVVLGMHRSGTSAVTRGLEVIGADLGSNTHEAMPNVNDKGFFEDNDIVAINEEILKTLSYEWHTLTPISRDQLIDGTLSEIKLKAINILREKTRLNNSFAMKDPRVARLLPFWQDVFQELDLTVGYVISIRNPLSVAESLYKRDQIEIEKACYLWLQHVLSSILDTTSSDRVVVDYDNMLDQPEIELARIIDVLMPGEVLNRDEFERYKNQFLDTGLRHAKFDVNALEMNDAISRHVVSVYEELAKVASDGQPIEAESVINCVDKASAHINELASVFGYITRQGWMISELKNRITDCSDEINALNRKRDKEIECLNQDRIELECVLNELQLHSSVLQNEINTIYSTISWKITAPLRKISWFLRRLVKFFKFYSKYRKKHPGLSGFERLISQSVRAIRKGGFRGLAESISAHEESLSQTYQPQLDLPIFIDDDDNTENLSKNIAVHAHIYYSDMAPKIRLYLENIPVEFHCYVTTDSLEKASHIKKDFSSIKKIRKLDVRVVENRGRDLAPMIVNLGAELVNYDLVLHIHSKRSPHNFKLCGWSRYLMEVLLGNSNRVASILNFFAQNKQLGILSPYAYLPVVPFMKIGDNENNISALLNRSSLDKTETKNIDQVNFPAGSMFWFRGKAIAPLVQMKLTLDDFADEAGQCDGTLAHAIERLFPYYSNLSGFDFKTYLPRQFTDSNLGTAPLSIFNEYSSYALYGSPVVIFDHNIGGGTNRYSHELINAILSDEGSVIRIYISDKSWMIEWIGIDDGMIFSDSSADNIFASLAKTNCTDIIVNSLYAFPNVDDVIDRIIKLRRQLNASLDYKVHDFYAICPSQHLLDYHENYCFVPQKHDQCLTCLNNNSAAHWASSKPVDIVSWRDPFSRLFEVANVISVFDDSTVEILRKAFAVDVDKISVVPHSDSYFSPNEKMICSKKIHIAVLGTLTTVKGADIVNALEEYIEQKKYIAELTVIGASYVPTAPEINVLGSYENKDLPEIIYNLKVNVILMPTIVPETYSYTISEAMKIGLPIVAFDIGAQGNRVKQYEFGEVIPLGASSEVIFSTIQTAHNKMLELSK